MRDRGGDIRNMNTAIELLNKLERCNIRVSLAGDKLRLEAPTGTLTPALKEAIAERKAELIRLLSRWEPDLAVKLIAQAWERANATYAAGALVWAEKHRPDLAAAVKLAEERFNQAYKAKDMFECAAAAGNFVEAISEIARAYKTCRCARETR